MKKYTEEKKIHGEKIKKYLLTSLFTLVFLLLGTQIVISNLISTSGDQIQLLEQRKSSLNTQNEYIKKQIAQYTSLSNLYEKAQALGFEKNQSIVYLVPELNVAMNY